MLMRAATVVQQLCKSCRTCFKFCCMFYFTCDRSFAVAGAMVTLPHVSSAAVSWVLSHVTGRTSNCKQIISCTCSTVRLVDEQPQQPKFIVQGGTEKHHDFVYYSIKKLSKSICHVGLDYHSAFFTIRQ